MTARILLLLPLLTVGCYSAKYKIPDLDISENEYSRIVNKSFDETWEALCDYAARAYFGIDNFEKDSGLLILEFGSNNPCRYIQGGRFDLNRVSLIDDSEHFSGNYMAYLQAIGASFTGRVNIVVRPVGETQTRVTVNARYVVQSRTEYPGTAPVLWDFQSGGHCTVEVSKGEFRTLRPSYVVENDVLSAVERIDDTPRPTVDSD